MTIKLLLPLILLFSSIAAQAQISVTVASGIGQTFIDEDVNFNPYKDPNFWPPREFSYFWANNYNPSHFFGIYLAYPISDNWKLEAGIEMLKQNLMVYSIFGSSNELNSQINSYDKEMGVSVEANSFPVNLIYENNVWNDRLFVKAKVGFAYTNQGISIIMDGSSYKEVSYGVHSYDTMLYNFFIYRSDYSSRSREMILFNSGAYLGWKFNNKWQVNAGLLYRHGFRPFLFGEATVFENVEVSDPVERENEYFMRQRARILYNEETPTYRHSFTTNGTALFGTLSLTYTFAKKEKEKK